jgi:vacuolar-type H+-ATPase subunit E/Vma4
MNASQINTTQMNALMTALQQQQQLALQQQIYVAQMNALAMALQQRQTALQSALQQTTVKLVTLQQQQDDSMVPAASLKVLQRRQTRLQNTLQQTTALLQQLTGQQAEFQGLTNAGSVLRTR